MQLIEKVQGSLEASKSLILQVDTVYVHTNVQEIPAWTETLTWTETLEDGSKVERSTTIEHPTLYQYTERIYTYDEFKEHQDEIVEILKQDNVDQYTLTLIESGVL